MPFAEPELEKQIKRARATFGAAKRQEFQHNEQVARVLNSFSGIDKRLVRFALYRGFPLKNSTCRARLSSVRLATSANSTALRGLRTSTASIRPTS